MPGRFDLAGFRRVATVGRLQGCLGRFGGEGFRSLRPRAIWWGLGLRAQKPGQGLLTQEL